MKITPVVKPLSSIILPLNKSQNASLEDDNYIYFTVNLNNCLTASCNLCLSLSAISNKDAKMNLLINPGENNYTFLS